MFYNPLMTQLGKIPTIVYPSKGVEAVFDRHDKACVEKFLQGLYDLHKGLISEDTEYMLAMLWEEGKANRMTDLWTYRLTKKYGFGPLMDVLLFRNLDRYIPDQRKEEPEGSASLHTIHLIDVEGKHSEAVGDIEKYLSGKRPRLPVRIRIGQDFYLPAGRR